MTWSLSLLLRYAFSQLAFTPPCSDFDHLYRSLEPKLFSHPFAAAGFDFRMAGNAQAPRNGMM